MRCERSVVGPGVEQGIVMDEACFVPSLFPCLSLFTHTHSSPRVGLTGSLAPNCFIPLEVHVHKVRTEGQHVTQEVGPVGCSGALEVPKLELGCLSDNIVEHGFIFLPHKSTIAAVTKN